MSATSLFFLLAGATGLGFLLFYASYSIRAGFYLKALCRAKKKEKVVALTFDDGPHQVHTAEVLDVLKEYRAPATFFCIGSQAEKYPDVVRRISAEGHTVGNHSYRHTGRFPFYSVKNMEKDLRLTQRILERITGRPVTLFRPPFGVTDPTIAKVVKKTGYRTIGWNIRSFDTRGESPERIFRRIVRRLEPGSVILLHDRLPGSAALLKRLLDELKEQQYRIISLEEMFNIESYETH